MSRSPWSPRRAASESVARGGAGAPLVRCPDVLVIDRAWCLGELKGTKTHQRRTVEPVRPQGVKATPYDDRHTYASLLIHEGRSPLLVAAALGHSTAALVWSRTATSTHGGRESE
jgi:integrase